MCAPDQPAGDDATTSWHAERAVKGDMASLEWLVRRLGPLLQIQAEVRLPPALRQHVDPDDLVADVWATSLPRLEVIRPVEGHYARVVVKYLSSVMLNRIRELTRRLVREGRSRGGGAAMESGIGDGLDALPDEASGVLTRVLREERRGSVLELLEDLSEDDRRIVVMRAIEQQPLDEVATVLGVRPGTAAVRFHRAVKRLGDRLDGSVLADLVDD